VTATTAVLRPPVAAGSSQMARCCTGPAPTQSARWPSRWLSTPASTAYTQHTSTSSTCTAGAMSSRCGHEWAGGAGGLLGSRVGVARAAVLQGRGCSAWGFLQPAATTALSRHGECKLHVGTFAKNHVQRRAYSPYLAHITLVAHHIV
jgi:hypothetical protein